MLHSSDGLLVHSAQSEDMTPSSGRNMQQSFEKCETMSDYSFQVYFLFLLHIVLYLGSLPNYKQTKSDMWLTSRTVIGS